MRPHGCAYAESSGSQCNDSQVPSGALGRCADCHDCRHACAHAHMHMRLPARDNPIDSNLVAMTYLVVSSLIGANFWLYSAVPAMHRNIAPIVKCRSCRQGDCSTTDREAKTASRADRDLGRCDVPRTGTPSGVERERSDVQTASLECKQAGTSASVRIKCLRSMQAA